MYRIVHFAFLLAAASGQFFPCKDEFDELDACHDSNAVCSECSILSFSNPFTAGFCGSVNESLCGALGCCEPCANSFTSYKTCLETSNLVICEIDCDPAEESTNPNPEEETVTGDLEDSGCFDKFTTFATCAINNPLQCGSCFISNVPIPDDFGAVGFCETAEDSICGFGNCCEPCSEEFNDFDECFEKVVEDVTFGLCELDCDTNDGGGGGGNLVDDCTDSFGAYSSCLSDNPFQCALCLLQNLPNGDDTVCENTQNTVCGVGNCCGPCVDEFDQFETCLETVSSLVTIGNCVIDCDELSDPPTVAPSSGGLPFCFSPENDVIVADKGRVPMNELKIGDMVQTGGGKFSRIYSFGHYAPNSKSEYLQLHVENRNIPLEITKDHMVFVETRGTVPAFAVSVGDSLLVADSNVAKVKKITTVNRVGAFAPFTESGTIVVNGVLASSYVSLQEDESGSLVVGGTKILSMHWLAHALQAPHRLICHLSTSFCDNETYTKEGISHWVHGPLIFSKWLLRQPSLLLGIASIPLLLLGMAMQILEYFFLKVQFGGICFVLALSFIAQARSMRTGKTKKLH
mmetsp:Transcript_16882/g.24983  ORF Transcript_16882/g.24983 Transcript_16882/m.24983 type:complete len:574 (-) Transcript_16882:97-1818(-)